MKLPHDISCADEPGPPIWNQPDRGTGSSRPPELSANCDAGSSRASVGDSDLAIRSAHGENSAAVGAAALEISWSSPSTDLHKSLHARNRRDDSLSNSRQQPRMIFSSSCTAADHERGSAIGGGWSPRCYACSFCGREFNSAQALGGHMNIHRRDRARLRTSPSPATAPHQADLSPALLEDTPPHSAPTNLYHTFEASFSENPASLNSTYTAPNIISSASPFRLLEMHPGAADPAQLVLAAHPSKEENQIALSCAPFVDLAPLGSTRCPVSAPRVSKAQNQDHSLFPSITPHASQLLLGPASQHNTSPKLVEPLNKCAKQARLIDCEAAELIQLSQSMGSAKRARAVDALDAATATTARQRSDEGLSLENRNCLPTPHSCQRSAPHKRGLFCNLDLELRLGQSSQSAAAGDCCMGTTAPRPP